MKVRAIIQARMLSTRFRGKTLIAVHHVPLLHRVISSVKGLGFIDEILVATTNSEADDPIAAAAESQGAMVSRGSAFNVLERFIQASMDMDDGDCIVRFTADNPFYNSEVSKAAFDAHVEKNADYTYIDGLSHVVPEFIQLGSLREAHKNAKTEFDTEHVTPYLRKHPKLFKLNTLSASFGGLRQDLDPLLTIDTQTDLNRFESLLSEIGETVDINEVYKWLDGQAQTQARVKSDNSQVVDLAGYPLGAGYPTFVVAEIGQNHNGDMTVAKELIEMAARCGADAVKFQKRDIPSELTKVAFERLYDNPNSFGKTYGEHRKFLELEEHQHLELKEYALAHDLVYFCTPCDTASVDLMERVGSPFYKVASRDLTNLPLLERLSKTDKVIILSTGMASMEDIEDAFEILGKNPSRVIIMQCTSQYPAAIENVNLRAMETLRERFKCLVGLSDHTPGVITSVAASVLGASIVEKHITLARAMKGSDHAGSLEEDGLRRLVNYIRTCEKAYGDGVKVVNPVTLAAKTKLARSLTSKNAINRGQILTEDMLTLKSPGDGLKWKEKYLILGKVAKDDIPTDVTLKIEDFK